MARKIKPAVRRLRENRLADARDRVLNAYDRAIALLNPKEHLDLIARLREDFDLRKAEIEYGVEMHRLLRIKRRAA